MPAPSSHVEDAAAAARAWEKRDGDEMQQEGSVESWWKDSKPFLLKLACLTGLQLRSSGPGPVLISMEVNHRCLLSLEHPEVFGPVVGLDHRGLTVEKPSLSGAQQAEVVALLDETAKHVVSLDGYSVLVDSFRPDVRSYVRRQLALDSLVLARDRAAHQVWLPYAYLIKEECLHGVRHNWAKLKLDLLKTKLQAVVGTKRGRRRPGFAVMAMLCKYVTRAVPVVLQKLGPEFPRAFVASETCEKKQQQRREEEEEENGRSSGEDRERKDRSDDELEVARGGVKSAPTRSIGRRTSKRRVRASASDSEGDGEDGKRRRWVRCLRTRSSTRAGYAESSSGDEEEEEEEEEEEASVEDELEEDCVIKCKKSKQEDGAEELPPRSSVTRPSKRCKEEFEYDHPQQERQKEDPEQQQEKQPIGGDLESRVLGNAREECKRAAIRGLDGLAAISVEISQVSEWNRSLSFTLHKLTKKKESLLSELVRLRAPHNL